MKVGKTLFQDKILLFNNYTEPLVPTHQLSDVLEVFHKLRDIDLQEYEATEAFHRTGCSCTLDLVVHHIAGFSQLATTER